MKLKRDMEGGAERKILIGMIVNDVVVGEISEIWQSDLFGSKESNIIAKWCIEHFRKFSNAPNKAVETYLAEWASEDKDTASIELIEALISGLNGEYKQRAKEIDSAHLVDLAKKHIDRVKLRKLKEKIEADLESNRVDQARAAVLSFNPTELNGNGSNGLKIIKIISPVLSEESKHGLIGDFLDNTDPLTEATPAAILAHLLAAIGTICGPGPFAYAGGPQPARLNSTIVGPTSAGRKGTACGLVDLLMDHVDSDFWHFQRVSGLSSGEGLICKVADTREKDEKGNWVTVETPKRLCVVEPEFSRIFANFRREGNVLSEIMRDSYDTGNLSSLTKNPLQAFGTHINIVGHITPEELRTRLPSVETSNGGGNRFLWFYSHSNKLMPHTRQPPAKLFMPFAKRLRKLLELGGTKRKIEVPFSKKARKRWEAIYPSLKEDKPGTYGDMVARRASMVVRMALIYCLVDQWGKSKSDTLTIENDHLRAALACWAYCDQTAQLLFGAHSGTDPLVTRVLTIMKEGPVTKKEMLVKLSPKQKQSIDRTLDEMVQANMIRKSLQPYSGVGRPVTQFELIA